MNQSKAVAILAGLGLVLVWGLLPSSMPLPRRLPPQGAGDLKLHTNIIERIGRNESYYSAFGDELRRGTYPAKSIFNWRTPAHYMFVALLSPPIAAIMLKVLTLGAVLLTAAVLQRFGRLTAFLGTVAQMGAVATAFQPDAVAVPEVWAGVLITISLCAYYSEHRLAGALFALAALFCRELAAPYCVVCMALAVQRRHRTEAAVWCVGLIMYGAFFGWHATQVVAHQLPGDLAHEQSWLRWNGLQFTLETVGVNGWLGFLPRWAQVIYVTGALAGASSPSAAPQVRWSVMAYFLLFMVAGQPFNYYWGFVTAPIWAFGAAHAVEGVCRLIASVSASPSSVGVPH
jgi:hypothetical protein